MIGGLLRILIISLVLLVAAMMMLPRARDFAPAIEVATVLDAPRPLPVVSLIDVDGEPFAFTDLAGRHALVFFGFTNCPDVCPLTLAVIANAMTELRQQQAALVPEVVFISVDPNRDTPARIRAYLAGFDETFIGVTASDATLAPLLEALSVTVHKDTLGDEPYNVVHNPTIYLLDDSGRWTAIFNDYPHRADILISDYLAIRRTR